MSEKAPIQKRRDPVSKFLLGVAASASLATAPESAQAGIRIDPQQFLSGVARGYQDARRRDDCIRTADMDIQDAERNAHFQAEQININADRDREALKRRTDLTDAEREIEYRAIQMERERDLAQVDANVQRVTRNAEQYVNSC